MSFVSSVLDLIQIMRRSKYIYALELRHNDRGGVSCVHSQCPQWERREARHDRKRELGETVVQTNGPIPANS